MTLPIMNAGYVHETKLPVSGKQVRYRPYLVKEEKRLLMAAESQNAGEVIAAMRDIVEECFEDVQPRDLVLADVEFAFLALRASTVGEALELQLPCSNEKCPETYAVTFNLLEVKAEGDVEPPVIELAPGFILSLRLPNVDDSIASGNAKINDPVPGADEAPSVEDTFAIIMSLMDSLKTEDEIYSMPEVSDSDKMQFLESLNSAQFKLIVEALQNMPRAALPYRVACNTCGHINEGKIEKLQDFFD